jgi:DNA replication protein DnaC
VTDPSLRITADEADPHYLEEHTERGLRSLERIPARYRDAELTDPAVIAWARSLVDSARGRRGVPRIDRGRSLLLIGPTGTGKTHTAYAAIRVLALSGASCPWLFTTAADLYARLRPRHGVDSEAVFDTYTSVALLVLDDLGAAKGTEWNEEVNYRLINHRYEHEQPTLITSNVTPAKLGDAVGERVASRLVEMADRVVLKGSDRRLIRPVAS